MFQRDGTQPFLTFAHQLEPIQHIVGTFDHLADHVALVRDTQVSHGVAAHQPIAANETEHSRQHLITAGAVVRVQQNDFVGLRAVDLRCVAQSQHVLGVFALAGIAHARLANHERLEAFLAQGTQYLSGRDVSVAVGSALVLFLREDGRGHAANLIIR